ncbi:MAG TPA: BrnT family toxin [Thermoanaerobaculia bacterium]|nr:BrnT family toxin [Thermoanaerobaculia bacterium]
MKFAWDSEKDRKNQAKHGVSFEEASNVFGDPLAFTAVDPRHFGEFRYVTMGFTLGGTLIAVVHTEQSDRIRIISARQATARERNAYETRR